MRPAVGVVVALAAVVAAGCLDALDADPADGGDGRGDGAGLLHAPWWEVGEWWQMTLRQDGTTSSFRLVHFWNDSATGHFWLGLSDRAAVVDHALHDTNPILGRIHWGILTPHESGIHAHGMYAFDQEDGLKAGDRWDGLLWGRNWSLKADAGDAPGTLSIAGVSNDGARLAYDYDPSVRWFSELVVTDGAGREEVRLTVTDHGTGAAGTYHFIRGRDYYEGPEGGSEDTFDVCTGPQGSGVPCKESGPVTSLAVEVDATWSSPGRVEFVDPDGSSVYTTNLFDGATRTTFEIPDAKPGTWTVRYLGGVPEGFVHATGFIEYRATL